ncbi:MAG: response regulator [Candidatus Obscuribacterales bacterium]|nr:response regulator [Candidatus Obscuribacterales bacterium]
MIFLQKPNKNRKMSDASTETGSSTGVVESQKSESMSAFSDALGRVLDEIGFIDHPRRNPTLATELKISRGQCYRLLNGNGTGPSADILLGLRSLGLSLDRILDLALQQNSSPQRIRINGALIPAFLSFSSNTNNQSMFAVRNDGGDFELLPIQGNTSIPEGALAVSSIHFSSLRLLGIVDDDKSTLDLLVKQLSTNFRTAPFETGTELLSAPLSFDEFSAFLVDWRLPDINGEDLVQKIRARTSAPIFILTGDNTASESIARALNDPNVHHVAKPADAVILTARIKHAMAKFTPLET